MILKRFSVIVLGCVLAAASFAQDEPVLNGAGGGANDWYIDLQLGGDVLFNPGASELLATNGVRPNLSFSAGKWIIPHLGMRLQMKSMWWKGVASAANVSAWGFDLAQMAPLSDGSCAYNIFYVNPHLDLTLSLMSCAKGGYAASQKFDIIPYVGIGYLHGFAAQGVPAGNTVTGNFGLMAKYRVTDRWDLNLELATAVMPNYYASADKGTMADLSFTLGFSYNIGGHTFSAREKKQDDSSVSSSRHAAGGSDTVYVYKHTETVVERGAPVSNTDLSAAAKSGDFTQPFQIALIEFPIESATPKQNYEVQYYNVAAFLAAYPDVLIRLDAYCDAETGTAEYNEKLAQKRAEAVRDILVDKYGIDESRIKLNPLGSREQVYQKGSLNRIVRITVLPK